MLIMSYSKIIFLAVTILGFTSCSGSLKKEKQTSNLDSTIYDTVYTESDTVKTIKMDHDSNVLEVLHFVDSEANGDAKWFYKNGQLKKKGFYLNGRPYYYWEEYRNDGSLKLIYDIVNLGKYGKPQKNFVMVFDSNKNIIVDSSHYYQKKIKDTVKLSSSDSVLLKVPTVKYPDSLYVQYGAYENDGYIVNDSSNLRIKKFSKDTSVKVPITYKKPGGNLFCARIIEKMPDTSLVLYVHEYFYVEE